MKIALATSFNVVITNNAGDTVLQWQAENYKLDADLEGLVKLAPSLFAAFVEVKQAISAMDKSPAVPVADSTEARTMRYPYDLA